MLDTSRRQVRCNISPLSFVYWLNGYFELSLIDEPLTKQQVQIIKNHLKLVFEHSIDPSMGSPETRERLQKVHDGHDGSNIINNPATITISGSNGDSDSYILRCCHGKIGCDSVGDKHACPTDDEMKAKLLKVSEEMKTSLRKNLQKLDGVDWDPYPTGRGPRIMC